MKIKSYPIKTIKAGYYVTDAKPKGDVIVKPQGSLELNFKDVLELHRGFIIEKGGEMNINIVK
ncbi:MAG: hypothetical protein SNJ71_03175 [Bacteroidales bacterium]